MVTKGLTLVSDIGANGDSSICGVSNMIQKQMGAAVLLVV